MTMFRNREEAGRLLAARVAALGLQHEVLALGVPRGGLIVAAAMADELGCELDVALARKIRAPDQPEAAIGAIGEDGVVHMDRAIALLEPFVTPAEIEAEVNHQRDEIERRRAMFRSVRPAAAIAGRSVIVVDDGIATGATLIAALDVVRRREARETIAAVPVAPADRLGALRSHCDQLVCLTSPAVFRAVSMFYREFPEVKDEEVVEALRRHAGGDRARTP